MLCSTALAAKCLPVRSQSHSAVAGDISLVPTQMDYGNATLTSIPQMTSVNDKPRCSAGVRIIVVQQCHSITLPTALLEG